MDDGFLLKLEGEAEKEIKGRGLHEPIINSYLKLYDMGELTYEQALQGMVVRLSNSKNELFNELVSMKWKYGS